MHFHIFILLVFSSRTGALLFGAPNSFTTTHSHEPVHSLPRTKCMSPHELVVVKEVEGRGHYEDH